MVLTHFSGRLPSLIVSNSLVEVLLPRIAGRTELCYWVKLPHIFAVSHCAPHLVTGLLGGLVHQSWSNQYCELEVEYWNTLT